jgi:hypothetical protein
MLAVSVISTMKVDSPRASMSEAPTRVKMRSVSPIRASEAGTKEPAVGHQDDERALPQVGRLAAHVGSGEEHDLAGCRVQSAVVGDERGSRCTSSITGCRPSLIAMPASSSITGRQ